MDWLDLRAVQGTLKSLFQPVFKSINSSSCCPATRNFLVWPAEGGPVHHVSLLPCSSEPRLAWSLDGLQERSQGPMVPGAVLLATTAQANCLLRPWLLPRRRWLGGVPAELACVPGGPSDSLEGLCPCLLSAPCPPPTSHLPARAVPRVCCLCAWPGPPTGPRGWWASSPHSPCCPQGQWSFSKGPSGALSWAWHFRPADGVLRSPGRALLGESFHPGINVPGDPRQDLSGPRGVTRRPPGVQGRRLSWKRAEHRAGAPFPVGLPGWQ